MNLSPEEQRALAIECGGAELLSYASTGEGNTTAILLTLKELAAYTAAVEAKERERCAKECEKEYLLNRLADPNDCAYAIRNLK